MTRIVVLERNPGLLRQIVRTAERCLREAAKGVEIECVVSSEELAEAFARERSDIVIVDEDEQFLDCSETLESLRDSGAEILVLRHASSVDPTPIPGIRELKKPINGHVLAAILTRMASRIVSRPPVV